MSTVEENSAFVLDLIVHNLLTRESFLKLFENCGKTDKIGTYIDVNADFLILIDIIINNTIQHGDVIRFTSDCFCILCIDFIDQCKYYKIYNIIEKIEDDYEYNIIIRQEFEIITSDIFIKYKDLIDDNSGKLILNINSPYINGLIEKFNINQPIGLQYFQRFNKMKDVIFKYTGNDTWLLHAKHINKPLIFDTNIQTFNDISVAIHDMYNQHVCYIIKVIGKYDDEEMGDWLEDIDMNISEIKDCLYLGTHLIDGNLNVDLEDDVEYINYIVSIPEYKETNGVNNIKLFLKNILSITRIIKVGIMYHSNDRLQDITHINTTRLIHELVSKTLTSTNNYDKIYDKYIDIPVNAIYI
jgi:hypothetical protein